MGSVEDGEAAPAPAVGQVEDLGRCDHGATIDHDSRGQRPLPEHGAVETVDSHQRIQPGLFTLVPGDVPERHEDASGRGHCDLRSRCVAGLGDELGQVRGPGKPIS